MDSSDGCVGNSSVRNLTATTTANREQSTGGGNNSGTSNNSNRHHKGATSNRGDKIAAGTCTGKSCSGGHELQQEWPAMTEAVMACGLTEPQWWAATASQQRPKQKSGNNQLVVAKEADSHWA